jgi:RHS repeat-associated protein
VTSVSINGGPATVTSKDYVVADQNPTGYPEVLEVRDGATHDVDTTYILGNDVIAQVGGDLAAIRYLIQDGHGSTRQLTDAAGAIMDRFAFTGYGMPIGFIPAAAATPYLYSGQRFDALSGLYYMRARMYSPEVGRFTATDPLAGQVGNALSLHRYAYTRNDPVNLVDPTGMYWEDGILQKVEEFGKTASQFSQVFAILGLIGSVVPFFGPLTTAAFAPLNVFLTATGAIGAGLTLLGDIAQVTIMLPSLGRMHQYIESVKPGGTGHVLAIEGAALAAIAVDTIAFGFAAWPLTSPFAPLGAFNWFGLAAMAVQAGATALFSGFAAGQVQHILTFDYKSPQGVYGAKAVLENNEFDYLKILSKSFGIWAQTGVGVYNMTRYTANVITEVGNDSVNKKLRESNLAAAKIAFDRVQHFMGGDFTVDNPAIGWMVRSRHGKEFLRAASFEDQRTLTTFSPSGLITDPAALQAIMFGARSLWETSLGYPLPFIPTVRFTDLPGGVLGEAVATSRDQLGRPTSGMILLDDDAAGRGWFVDSTPLDAREFEHQVDRLTSTASPDSLAAGRFDLLTVLMHELGHLNGFSETALAFGPKMPAFATQQAFNTYGFTAKFTEDHDHLDSEAHPNDLMNETLEPGMRKLPSLLDAQIIQAIGEPIVSPAVAFGNAAPRLDVGMAASEPAQLRAAGAALLDGHAALQDNISNPNQWYVRLDADAALRMLEARRRWPEGAAAAAALAGLQLGRVADNAPSAVDFDAGLESLEDWAAPEQAMQTLSGAHPFAEYAANDASEVNVGRTLATAPQKRYSDLVESLFADGEDENWLWE